MDVDAELVVDPFLVQGERPLPVVPREFAFHVDPKARAARLLATEVWNLKVLTELLMLDRYQDLEVGSIDMRPEQALGLAFRVDVRSAWIELERRRLVLEILDQPEVLSLGEPCVEVALLRGVDRYFDIVPLVEVRQLRLFVLAH